MLLQAVSEGDIQGLIEPRALDPVAASSSAAPMLFSACASTSRSPAASGSPRPATPDDRRVGGAVEHLQWDMLL